MNQVHGVKRLGYTIFVTAGLFSIVFGLFFLVYTGKCIFVDILTPLTMTIPIVAFIAGGYLSLQSYTDFTKINTSKGTTNNETSK